MRNIIMYFINTNDLAILVISIKRKQTIDQQREKIIRMSENLHRKQSQTISMQPTCSPRAILLTR